MNPRIEDSRLWQLDRKIKFTHLPLYSQQHALCRQNIAEKIEYMEQRHNYNYDLDVISQLNAQIQRQLRIKPKQNKQDQIQSFTLIKDSINYSKSTNYAQKLATQQGGRLSSGNLDIQEDSESVYVDLEENLQILDDRAWCYSLRKKIINARRELTQLCRQLDGQIRSILKSQKLLKQIQQYSDEQQVQMETIITQENVTSLLLR